MKGKCMVLLHVLYNEEMYNFEIHVYITNFKRKLYANLSYGLNPIEFWKVLFHLKMTSIYNWNPCINN